jgi:hypothetical protein
MKSTEVIHLTILCKLFFFFFQSNGSNGNSTKAPPHSVENSTIINNPSMPDSHNTDLVTYVKSYKKN